MLAKPAKKPATAFKISLTWPPEPYDSFQAPLCYIKMSTGRTADGRTMRCRLTGTQLNVHSWTLPVTRTLVSPTSAVRSTADTTEAAASAMLSITCYRFAPISRTQQYDDEQWQHIQNLQAGDCPAESSANPPCLPVVKTLVSPTSAVRSTAETTEALPV